MSGEIQSVVVTGPVLGRNGVVVEVTHGDPNSWDFDPPAPSGNGRFRVEYSLVGNAGPWIEPAQVFVHSNHCNPNGTNPNVVPQVVGITRFAVWDPTIPHDSDIWVRVTARLVNTNDPDVGGDRVVASGHTSDYPSHVCLPRDVDHRSFNPGVGTSDGADNFSPCDFDEVTWEWSQTPGGPYTQIGPEQSSPSASTDNGPTGLEPNTAYYFRARFAEQVETGTPGNHVEYAVTQECSVTTIPLAPLCTPNKIDLTSAELVASIDPGDLQPGEVVRLVWGTAPGNYPNVVGPTGASDTESTTIPMDFDTPVYFRAEVIDTDDADRLIGWSDECVVEITHTSEQNPDTAVSCQVIPQATGQTQAQLLGFLDDGSLMPPNWLIRTCWGTVDGGPYPDCEDGVVGSSANNSDVTDLLPGTAYYLVAQLVDDTDTVISISEQCEFTTLAFNPDPGDGSPRPVDCSTGAITPATAELVASTPPVQVPATLALRIRVDGQEFIGPAGAENFTQFVDGLDPDTAYSFIVDAVRVSDGEPVPDSEQTCQFSTPAIVVECGPTTAITQVAANLAATAMPLDPTLRIRIAFGEDLGGPYPTLTTAPLGQETFDFTTPPVLLPGRTYYYVTQVVREGDDTVLAQSAECSFATAPMPVDCAWSEADIEETEALVSGVSSELIAGFQIRLTLGAEVSVGADGDQLHDHLFAGLDPDTTYSFTAQIVRTGDQELVSTSVCQFTTPPFPTGVCSNATLIYTDYATINGALVDGRVGDHRVRMRWGDVEGGPYPNDGPLYAASGAQMQAISEELGGLDVETRYYYVVEVLDAADTVVSTSAECTFSTLPPPHSGGSGEPCPQLRPCMPWVDRDDLCCTDIVDGTDCAEGVDPAKVDQAIDVATEILWALSGRRFGTCELTIRPCREDCTCSGSIAGSYQPWIPGRSLWPSVPHLTDEGWVNCWNKACCTDECCGVDCEMNFPRGPVCEVTEVLIDGVVLDPSAYRVDDWRKLVRRDGECWPTCQSMGKERTEPGTWQIKYRYGRPVPEGGKFAAALYACEIAKACHNVKGCQLPKRVTQIARRGVTVDLLDPMDFLDKGRTGILLVDQWLNAVNPNRLQRNSRVYRPDARKPGHRRVGT